MKKPRVPLNVEQQGLNVAFSQLNLAGLPPGPATLPEAPERDARPDLPPSRLGRVVIRRETAHRRGKAVVVIHDFEPQISDETIAFLGGELKEACGCGGTLRGREIELQGEQAAKAREFLEGKGFRVAGIR
jgi:translation initiation factor 1